MDDTDARRRNHWVSHIARHAHEKPGAVYLRFEGRTITWAQIHERVSAVAAALRERGVRAGDRVAIMMTNRPEFLETMFAASAIGAIVVPVNFRLAPDEIAYILTDSGASLLVVEEATAAAAASARAACAHEIGFVSTGHVEGADPYFPVSSGPVEPPAADVPEDSPALIMYTSGTTGRPKGAVLTHENLMCQSLTLIRVWRLFADEEVNLCASPLFHIASIGAIAPMVLIGGTTVLLPSGGFSSAATLDVMEAERVTSVFLVPAQWQLLCDDASLASRDLSALKTMSWGAAPATTTLLTRMAEAFPGVTNVAVFGQTEMSPVTCALSGEDALRKVGSVGKPVSIVAARIVDDDMKDVPPGEVGEIVYRGPSVMAGYWQNPEATAEAFRGGWFHSGDLVRADEEGLPVRRRPEEGHDHHRRRERLLRRGGERPVRAPGRGRAGGGRRAARALGRDPGRRRRARSGRLADPGRAARVGHRPAGPLQAADRPARRGRAAAQRQRQGHEDGPAAGVPLTGSASGNRIGLAR